KLTCSPPSYASVPSRPWFWSGRAGGSTAAEPGATPAERPSTAVAASRGISRLGVTCLMSSFRSGPGVRIRPFSYPTEVATSPRYTLCGWRSAFARQGEKTMTQNEPAVSDVSAAFAAAAHRPNELRALSALAFEELRGFPGAIREMHLGIAARAFRGAGPASRSAQVIHDAVSSGVYDALGAGAALLGRATDAIIEHEGAGADVRLSSTRTGSALVAALNGLIGDRLERIGSDLDQGISVRVHGETVALDQASLRAAFPRPNGRIVVFLHGLMGTEFYWDWGAGDAGESYGTRLSADLGC